MPLHATSNGISSSAYACLQNPILQPIFQSLFTHNLLRLASVKMGSTVKVRSNVRWILERYHKFSLLSSGPVFQTLGPIESTSLQHRCKQTRKVWASL